MPPGVPYIVGNEAAERFSYYGMNSILVPFMTHYLLLFHDSTEGKPMFSRTAWPTPELEHDFASDHENPINRAGECRMTN